MANRELFFLRDLPRALHGSVVFSPGAVAAEEKAVRAIAIDSRTCREGALFVALPGENTDGHLFLAEAFRAGAVAALVQEEKPAGVDEATQPLVRVADTLRALQELAQWYARTALGSPVRIGITGSNGKTTTKEMVASILRCAAPTSASPGNLNSETGVPLAIFETDPESRYAVFEMAMSNPGEMEPLAEMIQPQYAIITNTGSAHIGLLGSREAIAREKKAIASRFDGSQCLLIPEGDAFTGFLADSIRGTVKLFGPETQRVNLDASSSPDRVIITGAESFSVPLGGYHNGLNALAAIALAKELGIPDTAIQEGLNAVSLPPGRSEIIRGAAGRIILNDCYNANPDSMLAALQAVHGLHTSRSRSGEKVGQLVLILGAMKELGDSTAEGHALVLRRARSLSPEVICVVGESEWATAADGTVRVFPGVTDLMAGLPDILGPDQTILLKGSRSIALEHILPCLREDGNA